MAQDSLDPGIPDAQTLEPPAEPVPPPNPVDQENRNRLGLIAILVEENLMSDPQLRGRIMDFAENVQSRVDHSKAFVLEVPTDESTFRLATALEKLYFEGIDTDLIDLNPLNDNTAAEDDNQLTGVILVGNVPIPVVHEDNGLTSPSLYPYTDFYRKRYIYNHQTDQFEVNGDVSSPTPEIWHGVLIPPTQDPAERKQQLIEYFDKNKDYSQGDNGMADFEHRLYYANFPELEKQMNIMDYNNYRRYDRYMEETAFNRYTPDLLKGVVKEFSAETGADEPIMPDDQIDAMIFPQVEFNVKKYFTSFAQSLRIYLSGINEEITKTGRWTSNTVDSPEELITLRDEYAKAQLKRKQLMLEKDVTDVIENEIPPTQRDIDVATLAKLNVKLTVEDLDVDSKTFTFYSFFDGQMVLDIDSATQCGIQVGQKREEDQSILENNSQLVDANRTYDPKTLLTPPKDDDDWKLTETKTYKDYGGCVNNNSIIIKQGKLDLNPAYCVPEHAEKSIFDIIGSIRLTEDERIAEDDNRCDEDRMIFKLLNEDQFKSIAAGYNIINLGAELQTVINQAYSGLGGNLANPSLVQKANFVIQNLLTPGSSYTYKPLPLTEIKVTVSTEEKSIDSILAHVEPTNDTIKAIKHIGEPRIDPVTGEVNIPQIVTPNLPSDGIRYIAFARQGLNLAYQFLNFFRIEGENPGQITGNLLRQIQAKQQELNIKTASSTSVYQDFFVSNSEVIEPIIWRNLSIDQKLAEIIPKYLDRDSFMPTPSYSPRKSPINKPNGYEVLHIVANGDAQGYQFGLNRAMLSQAKGISPEDFIANPEEPTGGGGNQGNQEGGGNEPEGGGYMCGDPSGVEIWEWFDALQCWITEEILPAEGLFALADQCSAAPEPPTEKPEEEDLFDELLGVPASIAVEMKRKSLVTGEEETVTVKAYNSEGQPLLGYIDLPVQLELDDSTIGDFSDDEVYIFTGERDVTFTAKRPGTTNLTVTMGDFSTTFPIHVFDTINMQWQDQETFENGRSKFTIGVKLKDPNGADISDINDTLLLAPKQPADGGFEKGGRITLKDGQGQIAFSPAPGKQKIVLFSKDDYIHGEHSIFPKAAAATQILLRAPPFIPIGEEVEIQVIAADSFGFPAENFNDTITMSLDDESQDLASLQSNEVNMTKGVGTITLQGGKETGDITLLAENDQLKQAEISVPLLARVDSNQWKETYPQNLFASFVGFPAGDFTQENYFGGTHLFSGKTEAVYSFLSAPTPDPVLTMAPNNFITTTDLNQTVYVEFSGNDILLQAFDKKQVRTLLSKKTPLDFDAVEAFTGQTPAVGTMYVELLGNGYLLSKQQNGVLIKDLAGQTIANLQPNKIELIDHSYQWLYNPQPEFPMIELQLTDGVSFPARILLDLKPKSLLTEEFEEIDPNLKTQTIFGGKSTNDPTGLTFYEQNAEVPETQRDEFYGISGEQKYLSLFASGANLGEAVKYNMPVNAVLLGDPSIKLSTRSTSSLNFNSASGQQIYEDPEGVPIASINHFNFNNDGDEDIALLMEDGRVKLLEGGPTEPPYIDRGNIANLADGGVALESFDFENDNYEDLVAATDEGRLAILNNHEEVITRTDLQLNIGKKMYKLLKADMDQDGYDDLVIHDSRGDILIFYYDPAKHSFPETGKLVGNFGYSLRLSDNLGSDIDIRYSGIPEPEEPTTNQGNPAAPPLEGFDLGQGGNVSESAALDLFHSQQEAQQQAAEDPTSALDEAVPKLPWPEGDKTETYFASSQSVGSLHLVKHVSNKDRPGAENVDLEETLTYTIEINPNANFNDVVLADTVPDSLTFLKDSVTCVEGGCQSLEAKQNSIRLFFSGINLRAGQKTVISYDVFVAHTPSSDILIDRIDEPHPGLNPPESIIDPYMDLLVSPPFNNTGQLVYLYSTGPRTYDMIAGPEPDTTGNGLDAIDQVMQSMAGLGDGNFDEDNLPPPLKLPDFMGDALDDATGNNDCFEDPDSSVTCAEGVLDDIAGAINDFACMGGGCFPMPFNRAFLVPPDFPLPAFSFPTTLPTPVGPIPVPSAFGAPSPIGMASILGPINSLMRLYVSPTLTGGIGIAMCWGPYPISPVVPPPVFPIPYPPPIGNCMVTALPVDDIYGGLCSTIRDKIMAPIMEAISSGISKIQSGIESAVSTIPGGNVQTTGPNPSTGGLEVKLAVNLGNSQKFDPPLKAFSNTHLPTLDSIGGVISSWMDRQTLEINNKLLTLPTFTIYLPDIKQLFTLDWSRTERRYIQWRNTMSGSAAATAKSLDRVKDPQQNATTPYSNPNEGEDAVLEGLGAVRGGATSVQGSGALKSMNAIETQARIYNVNALEGLYDVANTLPLVKLTEKPIQFDVPWLSAAEIQDFIIELQNWALYYESEYGRVKDKWEKLTCAGQNEDAAKDTAGKAAAECAGRHLAEAFGVSFDELLNSVEENIAVLQAWLAFPKQLVKFKGQLAQYIRNVACYLDVIAQMMGGWYATIQQQMISWAELILTIVEIIKHIKELFNLFTDFDTNCDICTNERYANFGWWSLLGLILPNIPIIQFPKIPDIVLDMSNVDVMLDIELPILNIRPKPIPLPPLPYIRLPDFPNISIFLQIPPLPILPGPPELPDLPALPPLPTVNLPTLPPPPKLPDVGKAFELIIPLVEKILQIWCMMKKALAPVPEQMLNDQITLLTNRPAYLIPLDLLKIQLPNIALFDLGFNQIRIETLVYLGLRINVISKPLEKAASDWNNLFFQKWPDDMNKAYQKWLELTEEKVQGYIDDAAAEVSGRIEAIQAAIQDTIQQFLDDKLGDPSAEADAWFRDREAKWEEWRQENQIDWTYEQYANAIHEANTKISNAGQDVNDWFDDHEKFIHGLNYLIPLAGLFEFIDQQNLGDKTQEVLDFVGKKLNEFDSLGPTVLQRLYSCIRYWGDCKENEQRYFGDVQSDAGDKAPPAPIEVAATPQVIMQNYPQLSQEQITSKMLNTPEGAQLKDLLAQVTKAINDVNDSDYVDYTVLKDRFKVPDYELPPRTTSVDKLRLLEHDLLQKSDQLMAEVQGQKYINDLTAIAGVPPQNILPYELANAETPDDEPESRVFTSAVMPTTTDNQITQDIFEEPKAELQKAVDRMAKQNTPVQNPQTNNGSCDAAVCLPDLVTNKPVPVIPFINFLSSSETLFMPNGNLVYSDGTGLFLKRDLTLDDSDRNTDTSSPRSFRFNQNFRRMLGMEEDPKEALNMLQSTFTENGAATFTWKEETNPQLYGYGIELERTITGYDRNAQNRLTADTKIILLPPNPDGSAPQILADDTPVSFGTLITSLDDADEAAKRFGVTAKNIHTGTSEARFPTINNALLNLGDYKAVYVDALDGSGYSMKMENGYYHIRMTWFDENARTANYTFNELFAPQVYADTSEPIDVGQVTMYYMPLYKKKEIRASELFVDLSDTFNYYWFIDPDNNPLAPVVGDTLTIPPQESIRKFKVKLVATQDIEDESFERFEKTFDVQVYAPLIDLDPDQVSQGIIAGKMDPIQKDLGADLSDIPFSVFRKRQNTWKNIGLLRFLDPDKKDTSPPLNDNDGKEFVYENSYYSEGASGIYSIEGFEIIDPSPIIFKDHEGNVVAEVEPGNGQINLSDDNYELMAVPASNTTPTHIAIVEKGTKGILGNVYYIADSNTDVEIVNSGLSQGNVNDIGVTVGDVNAGDDIIAANIPGYGPSFPGGVAIFNKTPPQINVALVDTDGSIRMMQSGYKLALKNPNSQDGHYIFQIQTNGGTPIYDVYIEADFDNMQIDMKTSMNNLNTQIGLLEPTKTAYAQSSTEQVLTPQTPQNESPPLPDFRYEEEPLQLDGSPFPDVDETHPFFNQILELYKSRVISGYGDGTFKPDQKLTRAEFVKIALGVTNCYDCSEPSQPVKERYLANPFPDVSLPAWYFYCISIAKELGMVTGYGDGFFRPDRNISRAEAAAVLLRQSHIPLEEAPENYFRDVPDYAWYVDYVYTAVQIGLIKENFGFVNPDEEITRGEFAFMAAGVKDIRECRLVDEDGDGVPDWWEMTHNMDPLVPDAERACACSDNPWPADTDADGLRDICDLDIDNDGVLNPICILNDDGSVNADKLNAGAATLGEPTDNCIFIPNPGQEDFDGNGLGNVCDSQVICPCLDNPNQNDSDGDGIRDVCDDDIDNDGVLNPICIFDDDGLVNQDLIDAGLVAGPLDNCIFEPNPDQIDSDQNGVGNACEAFDLCPPVPEDLDGVDDDDGCPEVNDDFGPKDPGIYTGPGPLCSFIDYLTDFMEGDAFMTAITDVETHEVIFSKSPERPF